MCGDVCVHVSIRGVLFHVASKSDNGGGTVVFLLTMDLSVVRRGNDVLDPQGLADVLEEP